MDEIIQQLQIHLNGLKEAHKANDASLFRAYLEDMQNEMGELEDVLAVFDQE